MAFGFDASAVRVFLGITPPLDVPYVGTRSAMVDAMLDMAEVGPSDYVIDLGTGDGRILIAAALDRGAGGLGVDLDPSLIDDAKAEADRLGLSDRVAFREQDLFDTSLQDADVVTMFLLPSVNLRLRPRLLDLEPGTRIVSNRFDMGEWRADAVREVRGYSAYLWIVPAQVAGLWRLEFEGKSIALDLEQSFQDVSGTALIDGQSQAVTSILKGNRLRFGLEFGEERRVFEGEIQGDAFMPTDDADWLAERIPE
ncbi:hypothetical protein AAV99_04530 [Aurantiacibacter marinus]|uniref:Methyltransferase domain-containing protein n=1 Tax=Aurantiacibacter marinus TaxID=874156 RepID=A0A0H0XSA0_9SPHN|nr:hypothetical protein AAV99_04530 [Aurantiacibacter marinus]